MGEGQVAQGGGSEVVPALVGAGNLPTNDFFAHPPTAKRPHSLSLSHTHLLSKLSFEEWQPKSSPLKWTLRVGGATKKKYPKSIFLFPSNFFLQDQGALTIIDAS